MDVPGPRTVTALAGIAISLALSVAAWRYLDTLLLFLLVPFVPILARRSGRRDGSTRRCPACGFRTRHPEYTHCPRDGTRLEGSHSR